MEIQIKTLYRGVYTDEWIIFHCQLLSLWSRIHNPLLTSDLNLLHNLPSRRASWCDTFTWMSAMDLVVGYEDLGVLNESNEWHPKSNLQKTRIFPLDCKFPWAPSTWDSAIEDSVSGQNKQEICISSWDVCDTAMQVLWGMHEMIESDMVVVTKFKMICYRVYLS